MDECKPLPPTRLTWLKIPPPDCPAPPPLWVLHSTTFELNVSSSLGYVGWRQSVNGQNGSS